MQIRVHVHECTLYSKACTVYYFLLFTLGLAALVVHVAGRLLSAVAMGLVPVLAGGLLSAVAMGLVPVLAGELLSAVAMGLVPVLAGGLPSAVPWGAVLLCGGSLGGGEPASRTKLSLGCLLAVFCFVVAHVLVVASFFFLRGGSDAAIADLFLDFGFAVFIEFSLLPLPSFLCSSLIDASSPIAKTVALYILLSDHLTVHVDTAGEVTLLTGMTLVWSSS